MSYQIALTFEDGVTRFIECRPNGGWWPTRRTKSADQHSAGLSGWRMRNVQVVPHAPSRQSSGMLIR